MGGSLKTRVQAKSVLWAVICSMWQGLPALRGEEGEAKLVGHSAWRVKAAEQINGREETI